MTDEMDRVAEQLRRWAERPAPLSPRAARTRVLARLPSRRRRPAWRLAAAGALAGLALAMALLVARRDEPVPGAPPSAPAAERLIVHELSSGTRLYIALQPGGGGDNS